LSLRSIAAIAAALSLAACAPPRPEPRDQAALYRDLERLVALSSAAGWDIDRYEIEELMPEALASVCQVRERERRALLAWIDRAIRDGGGPLETAYARNGKDLDRLDRLVELTRIQRVLARASAAAGDDCPFWLEPAPVFRGRQLLDDRWVLSFGGGGKGIAALQSGSLDLNAGGAGRLLFGRALGPAWMVSAGIEAGALAAFPKDEDGARESLVLGLDTVIPVVVRYRLINTYLEAEAGYAVQVLEGPEGLQEPVSGVHAGISIGAQAARRRFLLPGAAFGISVSRSVPEGNGDPVWVLKAGLRVAIDLAL
jgi:hypothetical protein